VMGSRLHFAPGSEELCHLLRPAFEVFNRSQQDYNTPYIHCRGTLVMEGWLRGAMKILDIPIGRREVFGERNVLRRCESVYYLSTPTQAG
jgi:hypothetical protein